MNSRRFNNICAKKGFDAVVATSLPNVAYASGFVSLGQTLISGTKVFAVAVPGTPPGVTLILPVGEVDLAAEQVSPDVELVPYGEFYIELGQAPVSGGPARRVVQAIRSKRAMGAVDILVSVLEEKGLSGCRVAVDELGLTPAEWESLVKTFRGRVETGSAVWKDVRMVKMDWEVSRLKAAARITWDAMESALGNLREGITEKELATLYEKEILERGGKPAVTVILFGDHSAFPNGVSGERRLRKGDLIRFDCGCVYEGYYSDLARTAAFGAPPNGSLRRFSEVHQAMLRGVEEAVAGMKPGLAATEVFRIAVETVRKAGVPNFRRTHCGHGIGVEIYDQPVLRETCDIPLEAGMVFCVEAPYYELGFGGIQVEDTVLVTEQGAEYLSPPSGPFQAI